MARQGLFSFPGIKDFIDAVYTRSLGIQPGVIYVRTVPQGTNLQELGTAVFSFDGTEIKLRDCKVVTPTLARRPDIWAVKILDRRWAWAFAKISGRYNVRVAADGGKDKIKKGTEKKPQELAKLLLDAMGEKGANVGKLPNDARPEVSWDFASPALELQRLTEDLGCRVSLGWDDKVTIVKAGEGAQLPREHLIEEGFSFNRKPRPDKLLLVGAPVVHEAKFHLEAVGLDTDGKVKPIDTLSYAPAGGWANAAGNFQPPSFTALADVENDEGRQKLSLARETVYRWYRIKNIAGKKDFAVPGAPKNATKLEHVLPIGTELTSLENPDADGIARPAKAFVEGAFYSEEIETDHDGSERYFKPFTIDRRSGIVKFSDYVINFHLIDTGSGTDADAWGQADLYLTTTWTYTDPETGQKERYTKEKNVPNSLNKDTCLAIRHNDVKKIVNHDFLFAGDAGFGKKFSRLKDVDNQKEADKAADHYLSARLKEFERVDGGEVLMEGLRRVDTDGAIVQVTIGTAIGPDGTAATRVSRNNEHDVATLEYAEKRRQEDEQRRKQREEDFNRVIDEVFGGVLI